jgi:recombination protein RecA
VRCRNLTQALKSTDLLLQGGGFGVVALDVSDLDANALKEVSLSTWFRFQRSIEKTPTILTIVSRMGIAKTCASLAIRAAADFEFEDRLLAHSVTRAEIVRLRSSAEFKPGFKNVCFNFYPSFSGSIARP